MKPLRLPTLLALAGTVSLLAASLAQEIASSVARVPFPKDYATTFQSIRVANKPAQTKLGTIYANPFAASIHEFAKLPYPDDSVIVMEWADPVKGANGGFVVDAGGIWKKGEVTRIDVMRRGKGFGAADGVQRAGAWEFASYRADGTPFAPAINPASCAECHAKAAGRDFVFRGRFPAIESK